MREGRIVFVTWTRTARPRGISAAVGASLCEPLQGHGSWPFALRYAAQSVLTAAFLIRSRPGHVIFTNPPFVAGLACLAVRPFLGFGLWADSHSGAFNDPRWARFSRANTWIMRRCNGVIVTNRRLAELVERAGARPVLLNWWVEEPRVRASDGGYLIVPLTYGFDEPVEELLAAARLVPDVRLALTGRAPESVRRAAPPNCAFTGWITDEEYAAKLASARGLVGLTTREDTMQLSTQEGLQYGLPMVISGTAMLREFFGDGVLFTDGHRPETLAAAIGRLWADSDALTQAMVASREEIYGHCRQEVAAFRELLGIGERAGGT